MISLRLAVMKILGEIERAIEGHTIKLELKEQTGNSTKIIMRETIAANIVQCADGTGHSMTIYTTYVGEDEVVYEDEMDKLWFTVTDDLVDYTHKRNRYRLVWRDGETICTLNVKVLI